MKTLLELFGKKRFWLPLIGAVLMVIISYVGDALGVDPDILGQVVAWVGGLFGAGTLANGAADFGKEREKLKNP